MDTTANLVEQVAIELLKRVHPGLCSSIERLVRLDQTPEQIDLLIASKFALDEGDAVRNAVFYYAKDLHAKRNKGA